MLKPILMKVLFTAVVCLIGFVLYVRFLERSTVFLPSKEILANPRSMDLDYEDVFFRTRDNVPLHGWLVKSPGAVSTLIFLHGNAGNVGDRLGKLLILHKIGVNVFLIDYRGYGLSQGRPTERGMYLDAIAAYDYLKTRKDLKDTRLIAYGVSLGGAAAVDLALKRPVDALIVDSTFTSAADMAKKILPVVPSVLLSVKLDNAAKISRVEVPKLFIHSEDDEVVPYDYGKQLYSLARPPKSFLKISGTHNDGLVSSGRVFVDGIWNFLSTHDFLKRD